MLVEFAVAVTSDLTSDNKIIPVKDPFIHKAEP